MDWFQIANLPGSYFQGSFISGGQKLKHVDVQSEGQTRGFRHPVRRLQKMHGEKK